MQGYVSAVLFTATVAFICAKRPGPALVTAIAGVAYFSMQRSVTNNKDDKEAAKREIDAARYADWVLTTPLILFMLLRKSLPGPWLAFVCGSDALMIATGYLGVIAESSVAARRAWFALSCAFFVPVLIAIAAFLVEASKKRSYGVCAAALIILVWLAYPVVWWSQYCVGEGSGALTVEGANRVTAVLDVVAKVGFGLLF